MTPPVCFLRSPASVPAPRAVAAPPPPAVPDSEEHDLASDGAGAGAGDAPADTTLTAAAPVSVGDVYVTSNILEGEDPAETLPDYQPNADQDDADLDFSDPTTLSMVPASYPVHPHTALVGQGKKPSLPKPSDNRTVCKSVANAAQYMVTAAAGIEQGTGANGHQAVAAVPALADAVAEVHPAKVNIAPKAFAEGVVDWKELAVLLGPLGVSPESGESGVTSGASLSLALLTKSGTHATAGGVLRLRTTAGEWIYIVYAVTGVCLYQYLGGKLWLAVVLSTTWVAPDVNNTSDKEDAAAQFYYGTEVDPNPAAIADAALRQYARDDGSGNSVHDMTAALARVIDVGNTTEDRVNVDPLPAMDPVVLALAQVGLSYLYPDREDGTDGLIRVYDDCAPFLPALNAQIKAFAARYKAAKKANTARMTEAKAAKAAAGGGRARSNPASKKKKAAAAASPAGRGFLPAAAAPAAANVMSGGDTLTQLMAAMGTAGTLPATVEAGEEYVRQEVDTSSVRSMLAKVAARNNAYGRLMSAEQSKQRALEKTVEDMAACGVDEATIAAVVARRLGFAAAAAPAPAPKKRSSGARASGSGKRRRV